MIILSFPKAKSISDLASDKTLLSRLKSPSELREKAQIAVIDDSPFYPEINLRNNRFQINIFKDIQRIEEISSYPIVLCDLQGVGLHLDNQNQGAYLIEEIKRNYPEKIIIAYTGGATNSSIFRRATSTADEYLKKDAQIDEWREVLDNSIKNLSNPILVWRGFHHRLVEHNTTAIDIAKIEHQYVTAILSTSPHSQKNLQNNLQSIIKDNPPAKNEIAKFVASKAIDLLFAALVA